MLEFWIFETIWINTKVIYSYTQHIGMNVNEKTTILVTKKTRKQLKALGRKGETYDDIIVRLMEEINCQEFIARQYSRLEEKDKFIPLEDVG